MVMSMASVPSVEATMVFQFQDGLDGYEGTADTWMRGRSSSGRQDLMNYGGSTTLSVAQVAHTATGEFRAGNQNIHTSMIRFDDIFGTGPGQVNPDAQILSAILRLTALSRSASSGGQTLRVGALMHPFVEGSSNGEFEPGATSMLWRVSPPSFENPVTSIGDGTPWGLFIPAGPNSPNQRHRGGPVGETDFHFSGDYHASVPVYEDSEQPGGNRNLPAPYVYEIDITPIAIAWQRGLIPNHGLYLFHTQSGNTRLTFASSNYTDNPAFRPMLEIVAMP